MSLSFYLNAAAGPKSIFRSDNMWTRRMLAIVMYFWKLQNKSDDQIYKHGLLETYWINKFEAEEAVQHDSGVE